MVNYEYTTESSGLVGRITMESSMMRALFDRNAELAKERFITISRSREVVFPESLKKEISALNGKAPSPELQALVEQYSLYERPPVMKLAEVMKGTYEAHVLAHFARFFGACAISTALGNPIKNDLPREKLFEVVEATYKAIPGAVVFWVDESSGRPIFHAIIEHMFRVIEFLGVEHTSA